MAQGDQDDFLGRLRGVLPTGWFPDDAPVLDAVLSGIAYSLAWAFSLLACVNLQTRLATATGIFLDIISADFFGPRLSRKDRETDEPYRGRIRRELLRPRATRAALVEAIVDLTGHLPAIFEFGNASDTGGYGDDGTAGYGLYYDTPGVGGYGARELPYQALVTVFRPTVPGTPGIGGYDTVTVGGYGIGAIEYLDTSALGVADQEVRDTIVSVIPAATVAWLDITNVPPVAEVLDAGFILDQSALS